MACWTSRSGASAPTIGDLIQRQPAPGPAADGTDRRHAPLRPATTSTSASSRTTPSRGGSSARRWRAMPAWPPTIASRSCSTRSATSAARSISRPIRPGALVDGLVASGQLNADWDAIWDVRTQTHRPGMDRGVRDSVQEPELPGRTAPCGASTSPATSIESWRRTAGRARVWTRSSIRCPKRARSRTSSGLTQGIGLDVRPFLAGRWLRVGGEDDADGKPGLDVFYNITPSLKLTATFNTDFGETEVDARQINLSRFSVLFPEKRSFFLQGAGVFGFASTGPGAGGRHSRRPAPTCTRSSAGRSACSAGRKCRIDAGVKLTGTVGRTDVGLLSVRTGDLADRQRKELLRRPRQAEPVPAVVRRRDLHGRPSRARAVGPDLRRRHAPGDVPLPGPAAQFRRERLRRQERRTRACRTTTGRTASRRTIRTTSSTRRSRSARFRRTSSRRSASSSATTSACSGWPAATIRGRRTS